MVPFLLADDILELTFPVLDNHPKGSISPYCLRQQIFQQISKLTLHGINSSYNPVQEILSIPRIVG